MSIIDYIRGYEKNRNKLRDPESHINKYFIHQKTGKRILMKIPVNKIFNEKYLQTTQERVDNINPQEYEIKQKLKHEVYAKDKYKNVQRERQVNKTVKKREMDEYKRQYKLLPIPLDVEQKAKVLLQTPIEKLEYK